MVGGKGTRLRPLTLTRPKPILSVTDKPCLGYLIDSMVKGGIEEIILACGYKSELLVNAIGDGSDRGVKIRYSFEEEPMGTGGAIKLTKTMQEREHTIEELRRLEMVRNMLIEEGIADLDGFNEFVEN